MSLADGYDFNRMSAKPKLPKLPKLPKSMKDETPTQPDVNRHVCPECDGKGFVNLAVDYATAIKGKQTCGVCWGVKWVSREAYERFRARQSGG